MRAGLAVSGAALLLGAAAVAQQPTACPAGQPRAGHAVVLGSVMDESTGLPVQGARVVASDPEGRRREKRTETDSSGTFRFCDLPAGERVRLGTQARERATRSVELRSGEVRRIELRLAAATSVLSGRVVESIGGRGIVGAEVRVGATEVRAVTGANGSFALPELPAGNWRIEVAHPGFQPREERVRIAWDERLEVTIAVAAEVVPLPPLEVTVRSLRLERAGFYERREHGFGAYLTRQDWAGTGPQLPSDLLRVVAGVRMVQRPRGLGYVVVDRSSCPFRFFMDGARVGPDFQMDDIPVDWIEALEIYRGTSQVPAEFTIGAGQARANCGVIVIWTRGTR
jgi:hypothetical protein